MHLINLLLWMGQFVFAPHAGAAPLPHASLFTRAQANVFLIAAMHAEAIKDPLKRCLAYPDPPDSHWDRTAVEAYCKYRFQPIVTLAEVRRTIRSGHARELDQLFAQALHKQLTDPNARAPLDRAFYADFDNASPGLRRLLDEWKRQSPASAFAFAASGMEYTNAAYAARGSDELYNTPKENVEAMDTLVALANTDLQKAVVLNPGIAPAWAEMISLGGFEKGYAYAESAARSGLAVDPGDYQIYSALIWLEQPNWYGSLSGMARITQAAQKQTKRNPTLEMLRPMEDFYRIDHCHCDAATELPAYTEALKNLAGYQQLKDAADTAVDAHNAPMSAIYLSEALRFVPDLMDDRVDRVYALTNLGFTPWAVQEGSALIEKSPDNEDAAKARGWAYLTEGDLPHARKDFEAATRLAPKDTWAWTQLGGIYVGLHQWDKAWAVSNRLVRETPRYSDGLLLRARIQVWQPRPGLGQTADYLALQFPKDKHIQTYVGFLRGVLKQRAANPGKTNAEILQAMLIKRETPTANAPSKNRTHG